MTAARVHHTGLTVADLERSIAFYRDRLGFELVSRQEKRDGYVGEIVGIADVRIRMAHLTLGGGGHVLELFEYVTPRGERRELSTSAVGITHLCLAVEDLRALYDSLRAAGWDDFVTAPVVIDSGVNQGGLALYMRDPDGITIELFQPARTAAKRG